MDGRKTLNIDSHNDVTTITCLGKQFLVLGWGASMTFDKDSVYLHLILEPLRLEDSSHIIEHTPYLPISLCLPTVTTSNFDQRRSNSRDCST
jgi:hypothetical protein